MKLDLSQPFDLQRAKEYFNKLVESESKIELKKYSPKRSLSQNAYLHVLFQYIALETGYTTEQAKVLMKRRFGSFMVETINGEKFLVSTACLDSSQLTQFIDFIRQYASEEMEIYLLSADDYKFNRFEVEKELQGVK
jgi:hypothetical protein